MLAELGRALQGCEVLAPDDLAEGLHAGDFCGMGEGSAMIHAEAGCACDGQDGFASFTNEG